MRTPVEIRAGDENAAAELIAATYEYLAKNPDQDAPE